MNHKLLLIVDPQNDFISGSLRVKNADDIITPICEWITISKERGMDICITCDSHPANHCSFSVFPPHCIKSTVGEEIDKRILNILNDYPYIKILKGENPEVEEFSAVKYMKNILNFDNYNEIVIVGMAGDYCVHDTVKDLCSFGLSNKLTIDTRSIVSIDGGIKLFSLIKERNIKYTE